MTMPPKFDAELQEHLQRNDDGLSPQLRDIFAEQERDHAQRRADRRFRAVFWAIALAVIISLYVLGLSLFFGGAS